MVALNVLDRRFYSLNELENAVIVDSEGLIYGYFGGVRFTDTGVFIEAYVEYKIESVIPDVERLKKILAEKGIIGESLEELVASAKSLGLEVPLKKTERPLRLLKGLIPVDEIKLIDVKNVEKTSSRERYSVIVLGEPREARYRGVRGELKPPRYPKPSSVVGKLVVSLSQGVLGKVVELVIGSGEVGLRTSLKGEKTGYVNWAAFLRKIRRENLEVFDKLASIIDYHKEPRIDLERLEELEQIVEKHAPKYKELLRDYVVYETARAVFQDIPWSKVVKVGDIVIAE